MEVDGRLEGLQPYTVHGAPYVRAFFSHADDPDTIRQCQLPQEAIDGDLRPGNPIRITYLLKTVMEIRKQ